MGPPSPSFAHPSPTFSTADTTIDSSDQCETCKASPKDYPENAKTDLQKPCHGWPQLVKAMVNYPCFECFQPFRDLNIKSLLYYQAELVQLREELHALEWEDHRKGEDSSDLCANVKNLRKAEGQEQLEKVKEIRNVLKDYNAALLQYSQVNELPQAETFNVTSFRKYIEGSADTKFTIRGPGKDSWGRLFKTKSDLESKSLLRHFGILLRSTVWDGKSDEVQLDLVVPRKVKDMDSLTRWISSQGVPYWNRLQNAYHTAEDTAKKHGGLRYWYFLLIFFGQTKKIEQLPTHTPTALAEGKKSSLSNSSSSFSLLKKWTSFRRKGSVGSNESTEVGEGEVQDIYHDALENQSDPQIITYTMKRMVRFTNFFATIVACLLPIIAIVVLAKLHTMAKILGFIALFTAIFAVGIMWLTDSSTSRTDIFTATAAFSAVLVVFVQNQVPT